MAVTVLGFLLASVIPRILKICIRHILNNLNIGVTSYGARGPDL